MYQLTADAQRQRINDRIGRITFNIERCEKDITAIDRAMQSNKEELMRKRRALVDMTRRANLYVSAAEAVNEETAKLEKTVAKLETKRMNDVNNKKFLIAAAKEKLAQMSASSDEAAALVDQVYRWAASIEDINAKHISHIAKLCDARDVRIQKYQKSLRNDEMAAAKVTEYNRRLPLIEQEIDRLTDAKAKLHDKLLSLAYSMQEELVQLEELNKLTTPVVAPVKQEADADDTSTVDVSFIDEILSNL
jgi:chromosome segregation ATPase